MTFNHDISWQLLLTTLSRRLPASEAWAQFIDAHAELVPQPYWPALKAIDIDQEQLDIVEWMKQVVAEEPVPPGICALYIGLFKFADENDSTPLIYLVGADQYKKEDMSWALDPVYEPANRYVQLSSMLHIDHVIKADNAHYEYLDWILPLAYCTFMFDEIRRTKLDHYLFTQGRTVLHIAVGHDSGDLIDLTG